jgi:hypothetical protein
MSGDSQAAKLDRRRGPGRPWKPGQSGNPSGMPADLAPAIAEARRLALSFAPKAIERLAAMLDDSDGRVVVAAAAGLLDRAGLRPYSLEPERVEVTPAVNVDALRAMLATRVAGLARAAAHAAPIELAAHAPSSPELDAHAGEIAGALPARPSARDAANDDGRAIEADREERG